MSNPIRLIDRLHDLRNRRSEIDNRIRDELACTAPDRLRIQALKRLKRHAKDQTAMICDRFTTGNDPQYPSAA